MSRLYETMYILRPDLGEQNVEEAIAKYQTLLQEQGAESITLHPRGKRRLAYEVKGNREGIYVQMNYTANPGAVELMEKTMRLGEEVIRYLTVKLDTPDAVVATEEIEEEAVEVENNAMQRGATPTTV